MRLVIEATDDYDSDFIAWLVEVVKVELMLSINSQRIRTFDVLQEDFEWFKPRIPQKHHRLDFLASIIKGIQNLTYKRVKDAWIIYIPFTMIHPYYFTTIYSICKFVNYGCNAVRGYPIFTKTFNRVSTKISKYYNRYLDEYIII